MEGLTYDYFKTNFGGFELRIVKIQKRFFKKYILFEVWDGARLPPTYVEKCTDDLRKMYKSIKEHFSNFPIADGHEDNVESVLSYCRDEWAGQHYFILEFLYAFLFKAKNHANIERPKTRAPPGAPAPLPQTNSFSDESSLNLSSLHPGDPPVGDPRSPTLVSLKSSEDGLVLRPKVPAAALKLGRPESTHEEAQRTLQLAEREKLTRVFQGLFQSPKCMFSASFPRILLFEKKLLGLSLNRPRSDLFAVRFKLSNEAAFLGRFVVFTEKLLFFYENSRDYIRNRDAFTEAFPLVKVDLVHYTDLPDGDVLVELRNESTLVAFQFVVAPSALGSFLLTLCIQLLKKESAFVKTDELPEPCNCLGDFVLRVEEKTDASRAQTDEDRALTLTLSYLELPFRCVTRSKRFLLPILNPLDVLYLANRGRVEAVEMTRVYDLHFNSEAQLAAFPFFAVSGRRVSDYTDAFAAPILQNFHENARIESGFKKSIKQLQIATFRLKRLFALRDFLLDKWTEFLCFKFPFFTWLVLALSTVLVLAFSFDVFAVFALFTVLFFFNPFLHKALAPLLDSLFFRPDQVNRHYVTARHPTERMKRKDFYLDMANVDKRFGDKQKLREKLMNAYDFSGRVPTYIHSFIDGFEKFKNIFLWKNYRKTEAAVFYLLALAAVLYFTSKETAFVYWVLVRAWYGVGYYRRVLQWNRGVLDFVVRYFIADVLESEAGSAEDYFARNRNSLNELMGFSREFAKFVEKWLDVRLPEDFWKNHFSLEQICAELIYSHRRVILPFYEEKRKPTFTEQAINFLYSTPSDYYYTLQQKMLSQTVVKEA